jgi:hypothetical protein
MTPDVPIRAEHTGDQASAAPNHLSQSLFSDPSDFFSTLKSVLPKANPSNPDDVHFSDLVQYSTQADNAKDRAAASIAAKHFDQIVKMGAPYLAGHTQPTSKTESLSSALIDVDQALATGNLKDMTEKRIHADYAGAANEMAVAQTINMTGIGSAEGANLNFANYFIDSWHFQSEVEKASAKDQKLLAAWPEINDNSKSK